VRSIGSSKQRLVLLGLVILLFLAVGCSATVSIDFPGAVPAFEYDSKDIEIKYKPYPSPSSVVVVIPGCFVNYGTMSYTHIRNVYVEVFYKRYWDSNWIRIGGQRMDPDWRLYDEIVEPSSHGRSSWFYGVPWTFECWFREREFPDLRHIEKMKVEVTFHYDVMRDRTVIVI
jgi:hypothetical protein